MSMAFELPSDPDTLRILLIQWEELLGRPDLLQPHALSDVERRRAQALACPELRLRFIALRNLLRMLLGRTLGLPPGHVPLQVTKAGKPHLGPLGTAADAKVASRVVGAPSWHFSLAHDPSGAALAFAPWPVGVDRETRRQVDCIALARRFFSPGEVVWLAGLAPSELQDGFLCLWTLKESLVKLQGVSLATTLRAFAFDPGRRPLRCYPAGSLEPLPGVAFATWHLGGGEVLGVAAKTDLDAAGPDTDPAPLAPLILDLQGRLLPVSEQRFDNSGAW